MLLTVSSMYFLGFRYSGRKILFCMSNLHFLLRVLLHTRPRQFHLLLLMPLALTANFTYGNHRILWGHKDQYRCDREQSLRVQKHFFLDLNQ